AKIDERREAKSRSNEQSTDCCLCCTQQPPEASTAPRCHCVASGKAKRKASEELESSNKKKSKTEDKDVETKTQLNSSDNTNTGDANKDMTRQTSRPSLFPVAREVREILGLTFQDVDADGNCGFRALASGHPDIDDEAEWLNVRKEIAKYFADHRKHYMSDEWSAFRPSPPTASKDSDGLYTFTQLYGHLYERFLSNPCAGADPVTWFDADFHASMAANALRATVAVLSDPKSKLIVLYLPQDQTFVRP